MYESHLLNYACSSSKDPRGLLQVLEDTGRGPKIDLYLCLEKDGRVVSDAGLSKAAATVFACCLSFCRDERSGYNSFSELFLLNKGSSPILMPRS